MKNYYFRDFGDLSGDSCATDIYNKMIRDKKRGIKPRKYNPDSWKKLPLKRKPIVKPINKKLAKENDRLHELQQGIKRSETWDN